MLGYYYLTSELRRPCSTDFGEWGFLSVPDSPLQHSMLPPSSSTDLWFVSVQRPWLQAAIPPLSQLGRVFASSPLSAAAETEVCETSVKRSKHFAASLVEEL